MLNDLKTITMNCLKLKKEAENLIQYVDKRESTIKQISNLQSIIKQEDAKDNIESYLHTPRSWYVEKEKELDYLLTWIYKRIETVISRINHAFDDQ